jgi:hypothetical protein
VEVMCSVYVKLRAKDDFLIEKNKKYTIPKKIPSWVELRNIK